MATDLQQVCAELERCEVTELSSVLRAWKQKAGHAGGGKQPWVPADECTPEMMAVLRFILFAEMPPPPASITDWCKQSKAWQAAGTALKLPLAAAPYPHVPNPNWLNELHQLPKGQELLEEHTHDLQRLLAYTDSKSAISREPMHGLIKWASPEAQSTWPAGSMDGLAEGVLVPRVGDAKVPSMLSAEDLGRVGYFFEETKGGRIKTVKDKYRTEHNRIFGNAQPPSGAAEPSEQASKRAKQDTEADKMPILEHTGQDWRRMLPDVLQAYGIPWYDAGTKTGFVLAGGAVISMVHPNTVPKDYDMFLVVPSGSDDEASTYTQRYKEAREQVQKMLQAVKESASKLIKRGEELRMDTVMRKHVLDVNVVKCTKPKKGQQPKETGIFQGQIILRLYETPAQVVHGFDLDACRLLFDGTEVWATEAALRALHTRMMLVEPLRQSPSYEYRLLKYAERYNMRILAPGLCPEMVQAVQWEMVDKFNVLSRIYGQLPFINARSRFMSYWTVGQVLESQLMESVLRESRGTGLRRLLVLQWLESWHQSLGQRRELIDKKIQFYKGIFNKFPSPNTWLPFSQYTKLADSLMDGKTYGDAVLTFVDEVLLRVTGSTLAPPPADYELPGFVMKWDTSKPEQMKQCTATMGFMTGSVHLQKGIEAAIMHGEQLLVPKDSDGGESLFLGSFQPMPMRDFFKDATDTLLSKGKTDFTEDVAEKKRKDIIRKINAEIRAIDASDDSGDKGNMAD